MRGKVLPVVTICLLFMVHSNVRYQTSALHSEPFEGVDAVQERSGNLDQYVSDKLK